MSMSVVRDYTTVVLTPCVAISRDRTSVHVKLDILEMEKFAMVNLLMGNEFMINL